MDVSSSLIVTISIFFAGIYFFLYLQKLAIKKGLLVKVEYSKPRKLFWAALIFVIVASNSIITGYPHLIVLGIGLGLKLYFTKEFYALNRN